jgi:hypothetical protein
LFLFYLDVQWAFSCASAANEAADDTSGQWPRAAERLSAGTMPPDFTAQRFPPVLLPFSYFFIYIFLDLSSELLSQMTKL